MLGFAILTSTLAILLLSALFAIQGLKTLVNNTETIAYAQSSSGLLESNQSILISQIKGILDGTTNNSIMSSPGLEKKGSVNVTALSQNSTESVPPSEQKVRVIQNPSIVSAEELARLKVEASKPHANTTSTNTSTVTPSNINASLTNKTDTTKSK